MKVYNKRQDVKFRSARRMAVAYLNSSRSHRPRRSTLEKYDIRYDVQTQKYI